MQAADLARWGCRQLETIDILDLQDRPTGNLEGIIIDRASQPMYLVVVRKRAAPELVLSR